MIDQLEEDALRFLGHCLEAYMHWRREGNKLGFVGTSRQLGTPEMIENRRVLNLSDDQFVRIDQAYARSSWAGLLEIEYCDTGSVKQKARKAGYFGKNYSAIAGWYRRDVLAAETQLYLLLLPEIDEWREECIHKPPTDRRRKNRNKVVSK